MKKIYLLILILILPLIAVLLTAYKWYSTMKYEIVSFNVGTDNNGAFLNIGLNISSTYTTVINLKGFFVEVYSGDSIIIMSEKQDLKLQNNITYNVNKLRINTEQLGSLGMSIYLKFKFKLLGIPFSIRKNI